MRVAFVELGRGGGGSAVSLLQFLSAVDRSVLSPIVVLGENHPRVPALRALGVEVRTVPGEPAGDRPRAKASPAGWRGSRWYRELSARRHFGRHVLEPAQGWRFLWRELEPELVYLNNGWILGAAPLLAARDAGYPVIAHERGFQPHYRVYRELREAVSCFICISKAVAAHTVAEGVAPERVRVVPNAVNLDEYHPDVSSDPRWAAAEDGPLLVSTGRLTAWKGLDVLLAAVAQLKTRHPGLQLVVAGDGEERAALERLAAELGVTDAVHFPGFVPDVRGLVRAADVLVHTAVKPEPFGRTVLEAAALGVPVVATNLGGIPEIVIDGETGRLTPPGNVKALVKALDELIGDETLRTQLARAGVERATALFDHRRAALTLQTIVVEARRRASVEAR